MASLREGMPYAFDAFVVGCTFAGDGTAAFALGDGTLRLVKPGSPEVTLVAAHQGACLTLAAMGNAFLTGGDDGRLVRTRADGTTAELAKTRGKWIEQIAVGETGLIAYAAGKDAFVLDGAQPVKFTHASTVGGLAFDPKGRRLAATHYDGISLWWTKAANQEPKILKWKGSHLMATWSPDGRFLVTSMQENALHGWRLDDAADIRMSGYPAKVRSLGWDRRGRYLFTGGAPRVIAWPFTGRTGPMGKEPLELGPERDALVTMVAAHPRADVVAAGMSDGAVWLKPLDDPGVMFIALDGAPVSALAFSPDGSRLAIGAEDGFAALVDLT